MILFMRSHRDGKSHIVSESESRDGRGDVNRVCSHRQWPNHHTYSFGQGGTHRGSIRDARFANKTRVIGEYVVIVCHSVTKRLRLDQVGRVGWIVQPSHGNPVNGAGGRCYLAPASLQFRGQLSHRKVGVGRTTGIVHLEGQHRNEQGGSFWNGARSRRRAAPERGR